MTFKHNKFDDSPTMRSLVKVAEKKGWIKQESLEKVAQNNSDLVPTENLTENILKLCSGLRDSGMSKFADELELKYFAYKKANALYNVSKEEGKDLVETAHPKGSHKLEGVEGDAVVETILDRQLKMLQVVEKKPSGKLASNNDILNEVFVALGQSQFNQSVLQSLQNPGQAPQTPNDKDFKGKTFVINPNEAPTTTPIIQMPGTKSPGPFLGKTIDMRDKIDPLGATRLLDGPWTDGARANSVYIRNMAGAAMPISKAINLLEQLKAFAAGDGRIDKNVPNTIGNGINHLNNLLVTYVSACNDAASKAEAIEKQRLSNVSDLNQSRVDFSEVGQAFKTGILGKTSIGKQNTFTGIVASLKDINRGLGELIYNNYSPGFDFDEPFMQAVKNKGLGILSSVKSELSK